MKTIIVILLLTLLFSPKDSKGGSKQTGKGSVKKGSKNIEAKQQSRPWYDISYDDMIKYDLFDDE